MPSATDPERLLGSHVFLNISRALASVNGRIGYIDSLKKTGGEVPRKKISSGDVGHEMEQSGRLTLPEYEGVLMVPANQTESYVDSFRAGTLLDNFKTAVDSATYLSQFGDYQIIKDGWDAAVLQDDVVKLSITIKLLGHGTHTTFTDP